MERRVLDLAEGERYLHKRRGSLVVSREAAGETKTETLVPFNEIESIVVHTPGASYSNAVVVEMARRGIPLVCCDRTHTPVAWLWPARGNFEQSRRMNAQASVPEALRDALWARIVRAKVEAQASVLRWVGAEEERLLELAESVRSGDSGNIEAQAARLYWRLLFGKMFQRDRRGRPPNNLLNYGYTVLRASVARYICAAGLHPSLGLHHHNRFNAFCLADDLLEPFRAIVDHAALRLWQDGQTAINEMTKPHLVSIMSHAVRTDKGVTPLSRCVEHAAQSLAQSFVEIEDRLWLPNFTLTVE